MKLKNWDSPSKLKILICSLFTVESFESLNDSDIDKILQAKQWLLQFQKNKNIEVIFAEDFKTDVELRSYVNDQLYLLVDRLIEKAREVDLIVALGKLEYIDLPIFAKYNDVHLVTMTKDLSFLDYTYSPFILSDPQINIYSSNCLISTLYQILKRKK